MIRFSRTSAIALGGVVALVLLSACDSASPGNPTGPTDEVSTQPQNTASGADGENIGAAPPVPAPLETPQFEQAPCDLLTEGQRGKFGGGALGQQDEAPGGAQRCHWDFGSNDQITIGVWFEPGPTKSGLSDVYVQNDQGNWDGWEPTQVESYPAVYVSGDAGEADGSCWLKVGVRDDLYLNVSVIATKDVGSESCTAAENAAAAAVVTMKGES